MANLLSKLFGIFDKKREVEVKPEAVQETEKKEVVFEGTKFLREDIILLVMSLDSLQVRPEKDYCIIGYLNKNKTKFKDISSGKVYAVQNGDDLSKITINPTQNTPAYAPVKEFPIDGFYCYSSSGKYKLLYISDDEMTVNPLLTSIYENYFCKQKDSVIYESQVVAMKTDANEYFDRKVKADLLEFSKRQALENQKLAQQQEEQTKKAQIRQSYSKDF